MLIRTDTNLADDIDFRVDLCETGSALAIVDKHGRSLVEISALPPGKMALLKQRLEEEFARGPRLTPFGTERRKPKAVELPPHPEGM